MCNQGGLTLHGDRQTAIDEAGREYGGYLDWVNLTNEKIYNDMGWRLITRGTGYRMKYVAFIWAVPNKPPVVMDERSRRVDTFLKQRYAEQVLRKELEK
jgi:hypothetical protein